MKGLGEELIRLQCNIFYLFLDIPTAPERVTKNTDTHKRQELHQYCFIQAEANSLQKKKKLFKSQEIMYISVFDDVLRDVFFLCLKLL